MKSNLNYLDNVHVKIFSTYSKRSVSFKGEKIVNKNNETNEHQIIISELPCDEYVAVFNVLNCKKLFNERSNR